MKKKLNSYSGKLSVEQIAFGIRAAQKNAIRLQKDAQVLLEEGRFPSATALAILSIEESGKIPILRELCLAKNEQDITNSWRSYRTHTSKNAQWIVSELVAKGARRMDDLSSVFDKTSDHPYILDQIKQISFYTDCLGNAHWSEPGEIIDKKLAQTLVAIAQIQANDSEVTVRELELWIQHLGPVWKTTDLEVKKALIAWYGDLQREGLKPKGRNEMEHFVWFGIGDGRSA
jgi:AbiV family abortive infection protein